MGAIRVEDLVTDPRVEKVIIANRNEDRARALADLHGAEVAPWSAMADIEADATVVAVGTDAHDEVLGQLFPRVDRSCVKSPLR
jgi:glutamyl-tRNA reductase